ncbi:MAG TPA: zinc ribbon domain-containing protein [Casimicrobiaceae bacterium]|nr:zinc ribbon domain-containing protein [Casimicrobiaceae bacterium]
MPIYEYRCAACGHELEVLQKLSEPPLSDCPECRKSALTKLVSAAGFQLKGSGWYATDFKGSGKPAAKADGKKGEGAAKSADSSGDGKSGSSDESKSTAKTEAASTGTSGGSCGGNCSCH